MSLLNRLTIHEASELIRSGDITPVELVNDCLDRIKEIDDKVLAWREVDEDRAIESAKLLSKEAREGKIRSPLHGIPIGVKDIFDVADLPTRAGTEIWEDIAPSEKDSNIVARLRELGAIIIGKTHTTKFAFYDPAPTRNPYNTCHTPGGSSSGSAASISSDMALLTIGSQTNASVCRPAAYSGVVGFKPTTNSIKMEGVRPLAPTFDSLGFFGQHVRDVAEGYQPFSKRSQKEFDDLLSGLHHSHVGVVSDPLYSKASSDVQELQKEAVLKLRANNFEIKEVTPPRPFENLIEIHQTVMAYEASQNYSELVKKHHIDGKFAKLVKDGEQISEKTYKNALSDINVSKNEMWDLFNSFDVLLAPPTDTSAPEGIGWTGNPSFTTPWVIFGGPLLVIPGEVDHKGLPLATMLASAPGTDLDLIKNGLSIERIMDFSPRPTFKLNHDRSN
ncbi:amidase [Salicibibacter cibarius]|uniref:Amidase n=1 Tax=Salicibibacter cibarius TaxID=2743000 RepID=A0A7T6Z0F3_9BACI|nr:amidase [Salicibibacter cibarius]QQK74406.1 amidase [Salicibibacter cibarius]